MKKLILTGILLVSSFALVNCGSSQSGDSVAVTPLTCDPNFGCIQAASCDPTSYCPAADAISMQDMDCRGICRPGEVKTGVGCLPQRECGTCAADYRGQCIPGEVHVQGRGVGYPRFINGKLHLEFKNPHFHRAPKPHHPAPKHKR